MDRKQLQIQGLLSPKGSIEAYLHAINSIPMLNAEEEKELALRYKADENLGAARQLVMSHLRFVAHIARSYGGYGLPLADLVQEGNVGLMKAVKRFDPEYGVRLVSFAVHWIKAEIHEFVLRNWRIVKVATTKAQRKLFFNLRGAKKHLGWLNNQEVESIAADLGVSPNEVRQMEQRLAARDAAFDAPTDEREDSGCAPVHYLQDHSSISPEDQAEHDEFYGQQTEMLASSLVQLDERSQDIVRSRWLNDTKITLGELAQKYGVSAERIRQLEANAMRKLRGALTAI